MSSIGRKEFLAQIGFLGTSVIFLSGCDFWTKSNTFPKPEGEDIVDLLGNEDIFSYIKRIKGEMNMDLYRQIIGFANEFKEGDQAIGLAADTENSRQNARALLNNTKIRALTLNPLFKDDIFELIQKTTILPPDDSFLNWTIRDLKNFVLTQPEEAIKKIMPGLTSDVIGCLVKLMSNKELIKVGQKVFNPLPNSKIGSKGYLSARVQPNSPTDNIDDIMWQVFNAWSYGVGDLVLGTNPVSSEPDSVANIEKALYDIITTFNLQDIIPNCVLSHIDIQSEVEKRHPGTTGIWFQSIAGTVGANKTFDITIDKMFDHVLKRQGQYGLYAETGQGADFTNGHDEGFDMVLHESRKYGFLRALKLEMEASKTSSNAPWVFVNDVAGFIGPEVFKTKEQLVRCCLEDTVMGKLHGLTIGLDVCSTLHMDITLEDLNWCIEQIMPANPAYLMALPTKNDPMLSYLTTAFNNHVKIREQFGYKVNDAMWDFFKKLNIIDQNNKPTEHFGDPIWVYYRYCMAKKDTRSKAKIYAEGKKYISEIRGRGVAIAEGYGEHIWDLEPDLDQEVHRLYEDAKVSLWTEITSAFISTLPAAIAINTKSENRKDYVYHPQSGEELNDDSINILKNIRKNWGDQIPDVQIIISDGLNVRALTDINHLAPFLETLEKELHAKGYIVSKEKIVITHGRVRAGYACGEVLFGQQENIDKNKGIIHIIGERPGSGHHNFSAYLTATPVDIWSKKGTVDHNISRVVSGISDTALKPDQAAVSTVAIFDALFSKPGIKRKDDLLTIR
ncbi:ethanolamine ammonia-lyase subunit EutB [Aquimarina sp. 2304DJ70-9]|uniref:ethanolamine ammonia-lyase subunit EutB n=1 Tax=Aquimarina penaris TaxID=3231044 RepID=UPI0034621AC9